MRRILFLLLPVVIIMSGCASVPKLTQETKMQIKTVAVVSAMGSLHIIRVVPYVGILTKREIFDAPQETTSIDSTIEDTVSQHLINKGYKVVIRADERSLWSEHKVEDMVNTDYFDKLNSEGIDALLIVQPAHSDLDTIGTAIGYGVYYHGQSLVKGSMTKPKYIYLTYRLLLVNTFTKKVIVDTFENHVEKAEISEWPGNFDGLSKEDKETIEDTLNYLIVSHIPEVIDCEGL